MNADLDSSNGQQLSKIPQVGAMASVRPIKPRFAILPPLQPLLIQRKNEQEWREACRMGEEGEEEDEEEEEEEEERREKEGNGGLRTPIGLKPEVWGGGSKRRFLPERSKLQMKRAYFDKECSMVVEHIYLGSEWVAKNREILHTHSITHVLNCVGFVCPQYFTKEFVYKTLWLRDSPSEDIASLLYDVFDFIEEVRRQNGKVFVHCCQGVSRSTSLVIAYIMWKDRLAYDDALLLVKSARGITNPNMGFAFQLLQSQRRVLAAADSVNACMYRLAPHSAYDPLHLVAKPLDKPQWTLLDSRGAFILQSAKAIYVWIGEACLLKMGQAARGAADQVLRYEKVDGPIVICKEGHEPKEFWDLLLSCSVDLTKVDQTTVEKTTVDRATVVARPKRVPSYDADYELYQIASYGGIFPPVPWSGVGTSSSSSSPSSPFFTRIPAREDGWSRFRRKLPWVLGLITAVKVVGKSTRLEGSQRQEFAPLHVYEDLSLDTLDFPEFLKPSPLSSPSSSSSSSTTTVTSLSPVS